MDTHTPVIRSRRFGDPILVPAPAVAAALLLITGLGVTVGWLAGRGSGAPIAATAPAPVVAERRCATPEPAAPATAVPKALPPSVVAARPPSLTPAPAAAPAKIEPPAPPAAEPARAARAVRARVPRLAAIGGDTWEPARM